MRALLKKFIKNERGATAIEYGLIAVFLAIACVACFGFVTDGLSSAFSRISQFFTSAQ
ncbi:Flp family type IVb pilin [Asticcacaulis sp. AND118]|uniref:Flp family type IVb pilin n=1 Tax=Asticcacaulis sp. AND118 TaxID=2840468 RepID=UPI001CFF8A13|nr:Flp family type IVb pilin [Asticcacaulis sp. AND118]UDF03752.1 Flp family type IVb pilin [Asticcacaulis sp. AND118]